LRRDDLLRLCSELAESISAILDENGYLTASVEELMQSGNIRRTIWTMPWPSFRTLIYRRRRGGFARVPASQLKAFDPQNTLAQKIVSEHSQAGSIEPVEGIARGS